MSVHGFRELRCLMKHKGFSLIELMVYLSLFLFLMYHCVPWSIATVVRYNTYHTQAQGIIDCCALHDLFIKDVFDSSSEKQKWIILSVNRVVWQKNDTTYVGWVFENNTLYRIAGLFNPTTVQWQKKHTIPMLYNCTKLFFEWHSDKDRLYSITLKIPINHVQYSLTGVPRYAKT